MFNPGLAIGQVLNNTDIVNLFQCGNMGGMRRSKATNTLVIVTDYTKGIYHDKWIGGILHYTGMGKNGDQDIDWAQNKTLSESKFNGVDVHLFEVIDIGEYIYCGRVELVSKPYTEIQPGEDGINRKVWMFPIRPVPDNNVRKPQIFVFKDYEDFIRRGQNAEKEFAKILTEKKKKEKKTEYKPIVQPVLPEQPVPPNPALVVSPDLIGKKIFHKSFGEGKITGIIDSTIIVNFISVGEKKLGYEICVNNKLIEIT